MNRIYKLVPVVEVSARSSSVLSMSVRINVITDINIFVQALSAFHRLNRGAWRVRQRWSSPGRAPHHGDRAEEGHHPHQGKRSVVSYASQHESSSCCPKFPPQPSP